MPIVCHLVEGNTVPTPTVRWDPSLLLSLESKRYRRMQKSENVPFKGRPPNMKRPNHIFPSPSPCHVSQISPSLPKQHGDLFGKQQLKCELHVATKTTCGFSNSREELCFLAQHDQPSVFKEFAPKSSTSNLKSCTRSQGPKPLHQSAPQPLQVNQAIIRQ